MILFLEIQYVIQKVSLQPEPDVKNFDSSGDFEHTGNSV